MERTKAVVQAELDQLNRDVSWTCGRAGVEGNDLSADLMRSFVAKSRALREELEAFDKK